MTLTTYPQRGNGIYLFIFYVYLLAECVLGLIQTLKIATTNPHPLVEGQILLHLHGQDWTFRESAMLTLFVGLNVNAS